jgi:exopolysaccharide biosynthesis predicted pyruvyltransferase EpsI
MLIEFIRLEETLRKLVGQGRVYYLPNSGNWGDALIRFGTLKFLRDIGLDFTELSADTSDWLLPFVKGGTVIYGGGGAWCSLWNKAEKKVRKLHKRFRVVVLPSTYERRYSMPNTTFFCRDRFNSQEHMPEAIFCHDMAFSIGPLASTPAFGTGYFFRTDKESSGKLAIPPGNNDLSSKGRHTSDIFPFINEIARHAVVHTDHLHIAVAACLLRRELHFYPGSYFKNNAIFLSSIQGYFDNVHFHHFPVGSHGAPEPLTNPPPPGAQPFSRHQGAEKEGASEERSGIKADRLPTASMPGKGLPGDAEHLA